MEYSISPELEQNFQLLDQQIAITKSLLETLSNEMPAIQVLALSTPTKGSTQKQGLNNEKLRTAYL